MSPQTADAVNAEDALVTYARRVIAGEVVPEEMPTPPDLRAFIARNYDGVTTDDVKRRIERQMTFTEHYVGQTVATFTSREGQITVLATGLDEIGRLRAGLTAQEIRRICIQFP